MKLLPSLFCLSLVAAAGSSACSSGDPSTLPGAFGPGVDPGAGTGGTTTGTDGGFGAGSGVPTATGGASDPGSPQKRTELVCTAGCEDTRFSDGWPCEEAATEANCNADWFQGFCEKSCGQCSGDEQEVCVEVEVEDPVDVPSTPDGGTDRPDGDAEPPPVSGGQTGWGSRYWDCCMQHCSWPANAGGDPASVCDVNNKPGTSALKSACGDGNGYTCWSMAPWAVSETLGYGYIAVPPGQACGECYQLEFTGEGHHNASDPGSVSLAGKTMIVQAANIGYDVEPNQFDLLIPGGGVGQFNACSTQWGTNDLGAQYGGFLTACKDDVSCLRKKCNSVFAGKPDLLAGCLFHADWMGGANNPEFKYVPVTCPTALTQTSGMGG